VVTARKSADFVMCPELVASGRLRPAFERGGEWVGTTWAHVATDVRHTSDLGEHADTKTVTLYRRVMLALAATSLGGRLGGAQV
jgi:hypothetical protein